MTITVEELEQKAAKIAELRVEEAQAALIKKEVTAALEKAENEFVELLNKLGKSSYKSNVGTLSISHRSSVKLPKTKEDKEAFFGYLKSMGIYEDMISVNSMTLNSFYKTELERAKQEGNADFAIPGINEVTLNETLSFRK